jgi:arylsulfatase A-like enzyme
MKKFAYLIGLFLVFACSEPEKKEEKTALELPRKPNIIWLVSEDLSPYIPSFGDSTIETPNISRLADEGVRYTNTFSTSGVCAPSRYSIATGTYPTSGGGHNMRTLFGELEQIGLIPYEVVPPPDVRMMSEVLRSNGYYATNNSKGDYQFLAPVTAWDESDIRAHWRNRPEGKPFFSVFNFDITHESQFFGPPMKRNLRFGGDFPENVKNYHWGDRIDSADWKLNVPDDLQVDVPPYLPDVEEVRNDMRVMYSNIIEMDKQVGFLLNQLEEDGLLENTIVVWYTDHGGPLPRQKRLMYDSGIKLPMIIRYPGKQQANTIDDQLISFVDFAPTMFSFAGIEIPEFIEGQAFAGPQQAPERSHIYAAADRLDEEIDMIRAVRDKRYKYLRNFYPEKGYYLPLAYREQIASMQVLLRMRDER